MTFTVLILMNISHLKFRNQILVQIVLQAAIVVESYWSIDGTFHKALLNYSTLDHLIILNLRRLTMQGLTFFLIIGDKLKFLSLRC